MYKALLTMITIFGFTNFGFSQEILTASIININANTRSAIIDAGLGQVNKHDVFKTSQNGLDYFLEIVQVFDVASEAKISTNPSFSSNNNPLDIINVGDDVQRVFMAPVVVEIPVGIPKKLAVEVKKEIKVDMPTAPKQNFSPRRGYTVPTNNQASIDKKVIVTQLRAELEKSLQTQEMIKTDLNKQKQYIQQLRDKLKDLQQD